MCFEICYFDRATRSDQLLRNDAGLNLDDLWLLEIMTGGSLNVS